jgi:hypothetical protein
MVQHVVLRSLHSTKYVYLQAHGVMGESLPESGVCALVLHPTLHSRSLLASPRCPPQLRHVHPHYICGMSTLLTALAARWPATLENEVRDAGRKMIDGSLDAILCGAAAVDGEFVEYHLLPQTQGRMQAALGLQSEGVQLAVNGMDSEGYVVVHCAGGGRAAPLSRSPITEAYRYKPVSGASSPLIGFWQWPCSCVVVYAVYTNGARAGQKYDTKYLILNLFKHA